MGLSCVSHLLRLAVLILCSLLCLLVWYAFARRPDIATAVTVMPALTWFLVALPLIVLGCGNTTRGATLAVLCLWLVFAATVPEEPESLLRRPAVSEQRWSVARAKGRAVRVVSLNCAGGDPQAAAEVAAYAPDIVLLQERPSTPEVAKLTRKLFGDDGEFVCGADACIIARGACTPRAMPKWPGDYAHARVSLTNGIDIEVVSLRLQPPVFRADLWNGSCWREQYHDRRTRRQELQLIARQARRYADDAPIILGGDFNAPAGDGAFQVLRPFLRDAFPEAGTGWGNTAINDYPFARIDQVWISRHWQAASVRARMTWHSDHRLVVCDLLCR